MLGPVTLLTKYGSFAVAGVVCLESMGLPLPGEAILIAAAIYAGKTGGLNIAEVIAAALGGLDPFDYGSAMSCNAMRVVG